MPSDALTYALCANELNNKLADGRINKIMMPSPDTLMMNIRALGYNHLLILSANPSFPRLHLTKTLLPNPAVAPRFLMHLRKHIGSGVIEEVILTPFERVITLKIKAHNELMIPETKKLIIEIMGKHSNIILVNENNIISDSIKHITADISTKRQVLPGLPYNIPPIQSEKLNLTDKEELLQKLSAFEGGNLEKYLLTTLRGLAVSTIREALFRALGKTQTVFDSITDNEIKNIIDELNALHNLKNARPCAHKLEKRYDDFFVSPYLSVVQNNILDDDIKTAEREFIFFETVNEAMDAYYDSFSSNQMTSGKKNILLSTIKNALSKNQKKLGAFLQKQQDALDCENDRKKGDLILSNLYKIRKGDSEIEVEDFFNNNTPLRISIDPYKTPQLNAQIFYKSYNKKKTALSKLDIFIAELNETIEYLDNLAYFAEAVESEDVFIEIADELTRLGFLRKKASSKKDNQKKHEHASSVEYGGYKIFIGKSSLSNDALVRKSAPEFVWFHASNIHGSHIVIENFSDSMPNNDVLVFAAKAAAYFSKARLSENVPVDYTFIKYVKKPRGAAPGKVIFTNQKTLFVNPVKP